MTVPCSCGQAQLASASAFTLANHKLHGATACGSSHTFGDVAEFFVRGAKSRDDARLVGGTSAASSGLMNEAIAMLIAGGVLYDGFVIQPTGKIGSGVALSSGIASLADVTATLAAGGGPLATDLAA